MDAKRVGVIGAGTMGNGIAQVCATAGLQVTMIDVSGAAVQRGITTLGGSLDRLVKKSVLTPAQRDAAMSRVKGSIDRGEVRDADVVIEAATENLELKL